MSEPTASYTPMGANYSLAGLERGECTLALFGLDVSVDVKFNGLACPLSAQEMYDLLSPLATALRAKIEANANSDLHLVDRIG